MKLNIKEPYKTAIIIGLTTTTALGVAYLVMPNAWRLKMNGFIKKTLKLKKDDIQEPTDKS